MNGKVLWVILTINFGLLPFVQAQVNDSSSTGVNAQPNDAEAISPVGDELNWPRIYTNENAIVAIYQPQIEKWEGEDLETRAAVAITPAGSNTPVYGVVWINARAEVDKAAGIVTLSDIQVTKAKFPTARDREGEFLALVRSHISTAVQTVALDHLQTSYAVSQAVKKSQSVPVKNDPPRIIYATTPSLLVLVDGPPALRSARETPDVKRVINTRALIIRADSAYYLFASDHWYRADDIGGPWQLVAEVPASVVAAKEAAAASREVDLLEPGTNAVTTTPTIYVSTRPAELIQSEGAANLVPIEGIDLLEVKNSDNAVFFDLNDQNYYVLISGRWFKAKSLNGPWTFVPYRKLPSDFARIPADDPKANARASVPGTAEAEEAVIANSIPQTATINRTGTEEVEVIYDGQPEFQRIESTPLYFAVNCPTPVIQVNATTYYAVENGIWFVAPSPFGPWVVAVSVPAVIYSIPPSCPIHYVTYVRIYGSTAEVVYEGYTPGYFGTIVCPDYVVVYGTGWRYRPYIGNFWVGWPCTYGFGASFACGLHIGFGFGFAAGFAVGTWCNPWWGPFAWGWRHGINYVHVSINHINIYHGWSRTIVRETHNYVFNSWRGREWTHTWANHFNPYSSRMLVREAPGHFHAYQGNVHARPEISRVYQSPRAMMSPRAIPPRQNFATRPSSIERRNNLYSDRAGNVYRLNPSVNGWERNYGVQWRSVPAPRVQELNRDAYGRSLGQQRFDVQRSHGRGFERRRDHER